MARQIIWIRPKDKEVSLHAPNPDTVCHDAAAELELVNGSTFRPGEDWSVFDDDIQEGRVRFQYSRNPPSTDATEYVGKTYRMTAFGLSDANYDVRYIAGKLIVTA